MIWWLCVPLHSSVILSTPPPALAHLGCHNKNTIDLVTYKQQKFITHSSRSWEVQDRGADRPGVWREPASWFIEGHLSVSSHGGKGEVALWGFCTNPIHEASTLMNTSPPKGPTSKHQHTGGVGFNIVIWQGHRHLVYSTILGGLSNIFKCTMFSSTFGPSTCCIFLKFLSSNISSFTPTPTLFTCFTHPPVDNSNVTFYKNHPCIRDPLIVSSLKRIIP